MVKSRQRIIDHGEVFTPPALVNEMLDLVCHECERIDARFLEPACGDGNFLAEVLRRKLHSVDKRNARNRNKWERDAILSVCSLYGIDLLADNVVACRERLFQVVDDARAVRGNSPLPEKAARAVCYILSKNIVQGDALKLIDGHGKPIVFPEWSPVNGSMVKRRDFTYREMLEPDAERLVWLAIESDAGHRVFLPEPVADYPPTHYLKLAEQAEVSTDQP